MKISSFFFFCVNRVDSSSMGMICGVALMGAPVILIEKLCSGNETLQSLERLRQVVASGVCEGDSAGKVGNDKVRVEEKTYSYPMDNSQFPVWLANEEDLKKIDFNDSSLPAVSDCCHAVWSLHVLSCCAKMSVLL